MTWRDLPLRCPDCRERIHIAEEITCAGCGRVFLYAGTQLELLPTRQAPPPIRTAFGSKLQDRVRSLSGWRRAVYRALYVHPVRFLHDRQRDHGKNAHERVLRFARSCGPVIVDIGSGDRRLLPHVVTADIQVGEHVDLRVDAHCLPFPDLALDGLILQHVLEHVADPHQVLREASRVLRRGGKLYVEVPFIFPVHEGSDYRRWTVSGLAADAPGLVPAEQGVTIGPFTALGVVARAVATHRVSNPYAAFLVDMFVGLALSPMRYFDDWLGVAAESQMVAGAVYVIFKRDDAIAS
jgi:SAM-dependent methyltransferase